MSFDKPVRWGGGLVFRRRDPLETNPPRFKSIHRRNVCIVLRRNLTRKQIDSNVVPQLLDHARVKLLIISWVGAQLACWLARWLTSWLVGWAGSVGSAG